MNRTVRAIINFEAPDRSWRRDVAWYFYENGAILTRSTTSREAYEKFLIFGFRIMCSNYMELQHMKAIIFYEEDVDKKRVVWKRHRFTATIKVQRNGNKIAFITGK